MTDFKLAAICFFGSHVTYSRARAKKCLRILAVTYFGSDVTSARGGG